MMWHKGTHHVDDLRESEAEFDGEGVGGVPDRADQLVVAALLQEVIVQALGVRTRAGRRERS